MADGINIEHFDVLIIGAGLSGIGAGARVRMDCPGKTFAILEGAGDRARTLLSASPVPPARKVLLAVLFASKGRLPSSCSDITYLCKSNILC